MKKFKSLLIIFIFFFIFTSLIACSPSKDSKPTDVVTTLYPQYDIAKNIALDKLSVSLLTPLGTEIHGYEPTARDIISIKDSKLFLYTSNQMDPWVKNILTNNINALDLSKSYTPTPYENSILNDNLHYWTDPLILLNLVNVIKDEIIKIDPLNKEYYETNATNYYNEILNVHELLDSFLSNHKNESIFFYGHNALTNFASRYQITITSLSDNYQPDAELTPGQLLNLKEKLKSANSKYLFIEELIDLSAPNALKNELVNEGYQINLLELHGFHNITKLEYEEEVTLVDLLERNYNNLQTALS